MGVDGVLDFKIAFAVYAPEIYNEEKTIKKISNDFNRFWYLKNNLKYWENIIQYIFVIKITRIGITLKLYNKISELKTKFPVDILTLDDIENKINNNINFFNNDMLINQFKDKVFPIMNYIINIDFSAEPFSIEFPDQLDEFIVSWKDQKFLITDKVAKNLINDILKNFNL